VLRGAGARRTTTRADHRHDLGIERANQCRFEVSRTTGFTVAARTRWHRPAR
jgi:hypothetical protein